MTDKTNTPDSSYSAKNITVLEGLEAVRRRPGMYIGSTGVTGLHHLIWEVVDNSIDEAMAGHATQITITLLPDHYVSVTDNGRGIPVDIHPQQKVSALEVVMTILHAGGKFGDSGYKISGGLHGVGVSVVNALSTDTKAEVHRDGEIWVQDYKIGVPVKKVRKIGTCKDTGTTITFRPDKSIFETIDFEWKTIIDHLRQHSYLTKGIHLIIKDQRSAEEKTVDVTALNFPNPVYQFYFEGGVGSYVRYLNHNNEAKHDTIFYVEKEAEGVNVEVALQYNNDFNELLYAFTNNIYNADGGTHVAGFRTALTRSLNTYARNKGFLKEKDPNLSGEDAREGLTTVISIKIRDPQFEGQTKGKLGNTEAKTAVETVLGDALLVFLEEHPKDAEAIVSKCLLSAKARAAAKMARDTILRKGALEGFTLPGKLADCSSKNAEDSELFIVEGDSAGGCFSGDTKVALADGRALSFIELIKEAEADKQNYCYTIQADGQVGIEKILNPRQTKASAEVITITLDNDATITCTPDHQFLLRDHTYKAAKDLTTADSLMPLYRQISRLEYRASFVTCHSERSRSTVKNPLTVNERDPSVGANLSQDDREKCSSLKLLSDVYKKDGTIGNYDAVRTSLPSNKNYLKLATLLQRFFNNDQKVLLAAVANYNHRIVSINRISKPIPVYDIEVPNTHNFALASGVFVHNSAKQGRDRHTQAILPLRGKVLNVERARLDKILGNNELKSLIIALGTNIGEQFDITKLRYHRIVIMTDADVDGAHIRTLLLTFFYRYFPDLINQAHIYIAQPPLYSLKYGKDLKYAYNDEEKEAVLAELEKNKAEKTQAKNKKAEAESMAPSPARRAPSNDWGGEVRRGGSDEADAGEQESESIVIGGIKVNIQRYKGLGEMNPEQLWETTMDPARRLMKKITADDAALANETFQILMGDEVEPRKKFIQTHAKQVQNLDI